MTLAELLAKLADKQHAPGCDCVDDALGDLANACTELAWQAKAQHDAEIKKAVHVLDTFGGPQKTKVWLTDGEMDAAVVATGHWTTEPPTTPGWYIARHTPDSFETECFCLSGGMFYAVDHEGPIKENEFEWWSMPLWLPEAPKEESSG